MRFVKFLIIWIASNLSIPFWIVGHVHLTVNVYEDLTELIASMGMNIIVAIGFWLDWKQNKNNLK
jgi:predicted metal-dependent TIM-barrel fold hydrolase